jgi:CMP-N-acetylneuraminate monooxygenase
MFRNLGKLKYSKNIKKVKINIDEINLGNNFFKDFIIYKDKKKIKIYSRLCDHAGGKIISTNGKSFCPIHMWEFNPSTGYYNNGVKKKQVNFSVDKNYINIKDTSYIPQINKINKRVKTEIRFFNHAFLKIEGDDFSFSTDPWAIGPAFNTGWWLKYSTKHDWVDQLNKSSFIYISHNHPDHLHPLTLTKINKEIPVVVPNFLTKSTEMYVKELGFKNVYVLEFNIQYNLYGTDLNFALMKSGDFREDSGIYFSNGNFEGLLSVDCNMINFDRLPKADFFGSSFAGGASGYPLMFENYNKQEQLKINLKDKNFTKKRVCDSLKKILPKYFMPYAGFFSEKLKRDKNILKLNKKNSVEDYQYFCNLNKIKLLNVLKNDVYKFEGKKLVDEYNFEVNRINDLKPEKYLEYYKKEFKKIDQDYIESYFLNSKFRDNLFLYICLTDDNFNLLNINYLIDFSKNQISFKKISKFKKSYFKINDKVKKLVLKVRKESFLNTVYNKLPWEDLSIGFQCKVLRDPNIYNKDFWYHFTNIYTTSYNVRSVTKCNACETLNHFVDNEISKSM